MVLKLKHCLKIKNLPVLKATVDNHFKKTYYTFTWVAKKKNALVGCGQKIIIYKTVEFVHNKGEKKENEEKDEG